MIKDQLAIDKIILLALKEDLGSGDITTDAIIDPEIQGRAVLETREQIILAGLNVFCRVFELFDPEIKFKPHFKEGALINGEENLCTISGSLASILKAERTALNFIQRMSGIATITNQYIEKVGSKKIKILDTRKTVPGLRVLDKYSVSIGGGSNHRIGLFDGILIKDNHIAVAGSITKAVKLAREKAAHTIKVEVEVESLEGVEEAINAKADIILLDNMNIKSIKKAVHIIDGKAKIEISGGINIDNIREVSKAGIDFISVGALTHSVRAVDLSLEII